MPLTSLGSGAAQTTGNKRPPIFPSLGELGIGKIGQQPGRKKSRGSHDSTVLLILDVTDKVVVQD
jgi:hypothetical protein